MGRGTAIIYWRECKFSSSNEKSKNNKSKKEIDKKNEKEKCDRKINWGYFQNSEKENRLKFDQNEKGYKTANKIYEILRFYKIN